MNTLTFWPHYEISKLEGVDDIRLVFGGNVDYTLNWLFLSTSGIHGSYCTLDDVLADKDEYEHLSITALIVQPRLVVMRYGDIIIEESDIPFLREVVAKTLQGVVESQQGNLPTKEADK